MRRCGYCGTEVPAGQPLSQDKDRCPCGARAITRLGGGVVLVHAPGCDAGGRLDCACADAFSPESGTIVVEVRRTEDE